MSSGDQAILFEATTTDPTPYDEGEDSSSESANSIS